MLGAEYALSSESAEQDLSSEEANGVRLQIDQATYDRLRWEYVFLTTALPFFVPRELESVSLCFSFPVFFPVVFLSSYIPCPFFYH
jgi:hypothetical protein